MSANELAAYEQQREALIAKDRALRLDNKYAGQVTELEKNADNIVRAIRTEEASTIWSAEHPEIAHPFPGMEFLTGKSIIDQTKLLKILHKMPKGALLHAHLDATVEAPFLLKAALEEPAMHVRVTQTINAQTISTTLPEFQALPVALRPQGASSICSGTYESGSWVSIQAARSSFSSELGGPGGFDSWVLRGMTINPAEAYGTHNTVTKIWQKFGSTFLVSGGFVLYMPIFEKYVREFLRSSVEDGVLYVEPRINFWFKTFVDADGNDTVSHSDVLKTFERIVKEFKAELAAEGRSDEFVDAKIIYSSLRFIKPDELVWYLEDCIEMKKEFPHLIVGFDMVGDENVLFPLKFYLKELLQFKQMQRDAGVEIPFVFHAGETLGDGTAADDNLYDAILLGTKRIGHGFSLVKHPEIMRLCRERDIALEVCPISNEILRLTSSMPMHPLPILVNHGISVALCSDDPSVFGNMGLSYDYYQVLVSSEVSGLSQLGAMARDSIQHALLTAEEKEVAVGKWTKQWNRFLGTIADGSAML
ncbi:Metallo-dependent hydrolase [Cylindrobasidium torrendii FP15055 ss-10]|uniref:adenosine deaminase n=1 Tax=Cylindrobasidium torrendii FP15055 ss-10 TaxID=1314674 RepID=A0A0D7BSJ8_9AGAR|nr:Metallo-dependent hydrolase [Cylindrobasidium torrendii FP15055 ss-10]